MTKNQFIEIYKPKKGLPSVKVRFTEKTVWLNRHQLSHLFNKDIKTIGKHINNVLIEGELKKNSVVAKFATTAIDGKTYQVEHYNLDMIISVGYRVKSKTATQFRIWATNTLRDHLVKGYTINENRLKAQAQKYQDLQNSVKLLENVLALDDITQEQARGIIEVVTDYAYALDILDRYDFKKLSLQKTTKKEYYKLDYDEGVKIIENLKKQFGGSDIFGVPKDESFKSSIAAIYQSAGGKDAYPSVEEKAAIQSYKDHSLTRFILRLCNNL